MHIAHSTFNRLITIEHKTVTRDPDYGTEIIAWATFISRIAANWQDALPSKSEQVQQGVHIATHPARVRLRYLPGVTSDMRIVLHGSPDKTFQITGGPAQIGRMEYLELMVEEYST